MPMLRHTALVLAPTLAATLLLAALPLACRAQLCDPTGIFAPQVAYVTEPYGVAIGDLDGDGELTFFDFLAFQNLFDLMDPRADFDGDGEFTFFDFLAFQNAFDAGCP